MATMYQPLEASSRKWPLSLLLTFCWPKPVQLECNPPTERGTAKQSTHQDVELICRRDIHEPQRTNGSVWGLRGQSLVVIKGAFPPNLQSCSHSLDGTNGFRNLGGLPVSNIGMERSTFLCTQGLCICCSLCLDLSSLPPCLLVHIHPSYFRNKLNSSGKPLFTSFLVLGPPVILHSTPRFDFSALMKD